MISSAKVGVWSSVVGVPILLVDDQDRVVGQIALVGLAVPADRDAREYHEEVAVFIADAVNQKVDGR